MAAAGSFPPADRTSQGYSLHHLDKPWCRMLVAGF